MKKLLLATAMAVALPAAAFAQYSTTNVPLTDPTTKSGASPALTSPGGAMTGKLNAQDKAFIHAAAIGGIAEVSDGQLAEQMGDDSVKQIGARMVTDHTKANDQLAQLSQQLGDPAPTQTDAKHLQMSRSLKTMSGSSFDTAYLKDQLTAHEKTIALFKKEISGGGNARLKSFASATLPVLEEHLSMIKAA